MTNYLWKSMKGFIITSTRCLSGEIVTQTVEKQCSFVSKMHTCSIKRYFNKQNIIYPYVTLYHTLGILVFGYSSHYLLIFCLVFLLYFRIFHEFLFQQSRISHQLIFWKLGFSDYSVFSIIQFLNHRWQNDWSGKRTFNTLFIPLACSCTSFPDIRDL